MDLLLIRQLELRDRLDADEKAFLQSIVGTPRAVPANIDIVREGDRPTASTLLLEGYTCRQTTLREGGRQITSIHVPGDFVDLHGFLIRTMDHGVTTLTPSRIALVDHGLLRRATESLPHLTRLLWLLTLVDAAIHRRWLAAMGRQSALSHTAHLLCEMYVRQRGILDVSSGFGMPLTQAKLADALGLSVVHVNRVVRELRETRYVEWQGGVVRILDFEALAELAEFDPTYLSLRREPR